jgi:hypothetical protein
VLSLVPSLTPLSTSTCSLLASGFFPFSPGLDSGDFGVRPAGWTGRIEAELSFVELFGGGVFHYRRKLRLMRFQFTAMIERSATRHIIKDMTIVVILYSCVVWSTSFWNIVILNTVLEKVRWNLQW